MKDFIYRIDFAINDFIAEHLTAPFLDPVMKFITFLGDGGWFWITLCAIFLCFKKTRRYGVVMGISLIFSTLVTNVILKPLIARPRPWVLREELLETIKIDLPGKNSFPSGHTTGSFSAACALFWENKKAGTPALILAALVSYSRLYFFVHDPTDVLGGILVGFGASTAAHFLLPQLEKGIKALIEKIKEAKSQKES